MPFEIGDGLNFNRTEAQNMVFQNLATAPATPVIGLTYFDTTLGIARTWSGTAWTSGGSGAPTGAAGGDLTGSSYPNPTVATVGGAAAANIADATTKRHSQNTDTGTTASSFQLESGNAGARLKNVGGVLQARNAADSAFADFRVNNLIVDGATTSINSNIVEIGDNEIVLNGDVLTNATNSDGGVAVKRLMADNTTRKDARLNFNNSTGRWELVFGDVAGTLVTAVIPLKLVYSIGDGTATTFVLTHNLNTRDVAVDVRYNAGSFQRIVPTVESTTVNTVTLRFTNAPTAAQFTATVKG